MAGEMLRTPTRQVLATILSMGASLIVVTGLFLLLPWTRRSGYDRVIWLAGNLISVAVLGVVFVPMLRYQFVHLGPHGITVARPMRRRWFVGWNQISHIRLRSSRMGGTSVDVYGAHGRVRLPLPVDAWGMRNPSFDAQAARIVSWWEHHR
jgi:hypothetical protein